MPTRKATSRKPTAARHAKRFDTSLSRMKKSELIEAVRALVEHSALVPQDGYVRLSGASTWLQDLDPIERLDAFEASYYYWQRDPLMGRAVQLIKDYTFGRGVTWSARDPRVKPILKAFWDDRDNRIVAKAVGQWELAERLVLAGEVFFVFFVNLYTGHVKVRAVNPTEVQQIICHPEDNEKRLYYERLWYRQSYNFESRAWRQGRTRRDLIPDWDNAEAEYSTVGDRNTLVVMHYVKINSHGPRGVPLLYRVLPWIKAYKGFMEDRATLTLAAATFAFKQKIKGSTAAVARMRQLWADVSARYGATGGSGKERREGAQTLIENEGASLDQFNFDTRSGNAYTDGRMIRQQVAAGTGITEQNLTGDPSVANLASATQMEGPMQKMFESWQQLWKDEYSDIFDFVIRMAIEYGQLPPDVDRSVEVNFPPIVTKDLPTVINAVAQLISAQGLAQVQYIPARRLAAYIAEAFGETDVDKVLDELGLSKDASIPAPVPRSTELSLPDDVADSIEAAIESVRAVMGKHKAAPNGNGVG